MSSEKETKYFSAVSYNGNVYNFVVTKEGYIFCTEFGMHIPASIIELKPNFVLRNKNGESIYSLSDYFREGFVPKKDGDKIFTWDIEPEVFNYLIENKKVIFSKQMAILYGFEEEYINKSYNAAYETRTHKRTRNNNQQRLRTLTNIKHEIFGSPKD